MIANNNNYLMTTEMKVHRSKTLKVFFQVFFRCFSGVFQVFFKVFFKCIIIQLRGRIGKHTDSGA